MATTEEASFNDLTSGKKRFTKWKYKIKKGTTNAPMHKYRP